MEAQFISRPIDHVLSPIPGSTDFVVRSGIRYYSKILDKLITVECNFITDLASVPRALWWLYPPSGLYTLAVVLHDWLFWSQQVSFKHANEVLREAMIVCGCSKFAAAAFYSAVSIGSRSIYTKYTKQSEHQFNKGFAIITQEGNIIDPDRVAA